MIPYATLLAPEMTTKLIFAQIPFSLFLFFVAFFIVFLFNKYFFLSTLSEDL